MVESWQWAVGSLQLAVGEESDLIVFLPTANCQL